MYEGVPIPRDICVKFTDACCHSANDSASRLRFSKCPDIFASPMSAIFTTPNSFNSKLSGLMSRWMMPRSWAYCKPRATWSAYPAACSSEIAPSARTISPRLRPHTNSMLMKWNPSAFPTSCTCTIFEWFNWAALSASRVKRVSASGFSAKRAGKTLSATSRSSEICRARNTAPIPPAPSRRNIR